MIKMATGAVIAILRLLGIVVGVPMAFVGLISVSAFDGGAGGWVTVFGGLLLFSGGLAGLVYGLGVLICPGHCRSANGRRAGTHCRCAPGTLQPNQPIRFDRSLWGPKRPKT